MVMLKNWCAQNFKIVTTYNVEAGGGTGAWGGSESGSRADKGKESGGGLHCDSLDFSLS